jgi:mannose-6-phosphate isomerase-like protein (cupin superfamily)
LSGEESSRPLAPALESQERPWGYWEVLAIGQGFKVKRMVLKAGHRMSLQKHQHRHEHWFVFGGEAQVTCEQACFHLAERETTTIPAGATHRIENRGTDPLIIIEIQIGDCCEEEDIVRLEDDYAR